MSCNICVETFNRSNRLAITCPKCEFQSCRSCCETYLTNSNEDANCMNCKYNWDYKTMSSMFTKTFIDNRYKKHYEQILYEREVALLPATQPLVEEEIRKENIQKEIVKVHDKITHLKNLLRLLNVEYHKQPELQKQNFVRQCPNGECRGFLNNQWKCGLCNNWSCAECHEVKGELRNTHHTCKPENVETAKLLRRDTKSCPKCTTPISKIEGCDQMFCTQCHTAFSWNTGRIETGVIHNPHYFEWRSQNGTQQRNLLEVQCGREIDHEIVGILNRICNTDIIYNIARNVLHIRQVELPKYAVNRFNDNSDLRIRYLRSQITEKVFKQTLQKRFKTNEKKNEIGAVIATYTHCVTDIIYRLIVEYKNPQAIIDLTNDTISPIESKYYYELQELIRYTNDCFKNISKIYKNKPIQITTGGYLS
jgi:hypothetical protein